jgi:hypothetical protein
MPLRRTNGGNFDESHSRLNASTVRRAVQSVDFSVGNRSGCGGFAGLRGLHLKSRRTIDVGRQVATRARTGRLGTAACDPAAAGFACGTATGRAWTAPDDSACSALTANTGRNARAAGGRRRRPIFTAKVIQYEPAEPSSCEPVAGLSKWRGRRSGRTRRQ